MTVVPRPPFASFGSDVSQFLDSVGTFFSNLADLSWGPLLLALLCYAGYLTLRSRALYNAVQAAYPTERVRWRDVWGGYVAGVGINQVFPLGGGTLVQYFLTRISIPASSYPAVIAAIWTGLVFDWAANLLVLAFAFTQGVFPKPPDFSKLPAFDLAFFASHPRFTLFALTALAIGALVGFALLSTKVKAFWARVRQGFTILADRRRWAREMATWQSAAWLARFAAYWFLLDAFHIGGSVRNVLLVLGVQVVALLVPFTPGGAGVQQALLLTVFAGSATASQVAAFSVGQQIALAVAAVGMGFAALVLIFRFRSFKEVIRRGREHRRAEDAPDKVTPASTF
ncbi:MAG TPA: lysylphosphatidylglycerol synthase domain-containing protein [Conexibacter sp.]|nr:lysylphosphatidylglycerol synthase domain-containing protein [Conexibacter sp.]